MCLNKFWFISHFPFNTLSVHEIRRILLWHQSESEQFFKHISAVSKPQAINKCENTLIMPYIGALLGVILDLYRDRLKLLKLDKQRTYKQQYAFLSLFDLVCACRYTQTVLCWFKFMFSCLSSKICAFLTLIFYSTKLKRTTVRAVAMKPQNRIVNLFLSYYYLLFLSYYYFLILSLSKYLTWPIVILAQV